MQPFPLIAPARERLERLGQEFLADFLGRVARRHPENVQALVELGNVLTRLGRLEEGLSIDRRLVRLAPQDPVAHYNLACSLALLKHVDEALNALERAVELGYDDSEHLIADQDLAELHREARFRELVRRLGGEPADLSSL